MKPGDWSQRRAGRRGRALALVLAFAAACAGEDGEAGAASGATPDGAAGGGSAAVRPGVDVLLGDSLGLVRGMRVGLVTNQTGVDADGVSTIDRLAAAPDVELVALYSPEHGIRGAAEAGEHVESGQDERTGLPIHSLYGDTRKPTPEMLEGVDVLLFDIQDVGARYYTYVYTMALAMEAAGEAGIPFVVLDRPNPIGGERVQGNVLDPAYATFVGLYPVPMRHGMTPGELARLFRDAFGVEAELTVVPAEGWRRAMSFGETGLPWIAPSPNMPNTTSALHYPGTCLFEGTPLSVGRGTDRAFQWVGAPWLDGEALAAALNAYGLPGVRFEAATFTPESPGDGKFGGETVHGVRFVATDPGAYDPTRAAVAALLETRRASGDRWSWRVSHFDRLAGTDALRVGLDRAAGEEADGDPNAALEALTGAWPSQQRAFARLREPALLYR